MLGVELTECGVIKLSTIVSLKRADTAPKLCASKGMERHDVLGNLRFAAQRDGPNKMREIIQEHKIILKASETCNR